MQSVASSEYAAAASNQEEDVHYIWRRNCPYLYDTMLSYTLEWPTLTVDWLPNSYRSADGSYSVHKVIYGTNTSGQEPNYLIIAEVHIGDLEANDDLMSHESFAEYSYNPDNTNTSAVQFEVKAKLNHPEEVNRALHMPEHPFIIASRVVNGDILVFDYSKHESFPTDELVHPQLLLRGHAREGYAMAWGSGPSGKSYLVSGGSDSVINLWDFDKSTYGVLNASARSHFNYAQDADSAPSGPTEPRLPVLEPVKSISWHSSDVNDLEWHPSSHPVFGSVSDDGALAFWDLRSSSSADRPSLFTRTESGINTLSFNQFVPTMVSTGNLDGLVQVWDVRNLREELFSLNSHSEKPVICMEWSRWSPNILLSGGADSKVIVWDLCRSRPQDENHSSAALQDADGSVRGLTKPPGCGPQQDDSSDPHVVFMHYGHSAPITSVSWNPNEHGDPLLVASASEDNTIQFWQFSDTFL